MTSTAQSTSGLGLSARYVVGLLALAVVATLAGVGLAALRDGGETPSAPVVEEPPQTTAAASEPPAVTATTEESVEETATTHEVAPGETLSAIAARYGVTVEALQEANDLDSPDRLQLGQVLDIPEADGD